MQCRIGTSTFAPTIGVFVPMTTARTARNTNVEQSVSQPWDGIDLATKKVSLDQIECGDKQTDVAKTVEREIVRSDMSDNQKQASWQSS